FVEVDSRCRATVCSSLRANPDCGTSEMTRLQAVNSALRIDFGQSFPSLPRRGKGRLMTFHYNRIGQREHRRSLRNNATEAERRLWFHLRGKQLGVKFRRQYSIDGFVVDFYAPSCKLAVEVDGDSHFTGNSPAYDRKRTSCLARFGIEVIRFTNTEVIAQLSARVEEIVQATQRGRVPPQAPSQ